MIPEVDRLLQSYQFFTRDKIPAGVYQGVGETPTVSVPALWVTSAEVDEELIYGVTKALWHENARKLLDDGHPRGTTIVMEDALEGVGIPLHPGAERFYREVGLIEE